MTDQPTPNQPPSQPKFDPGAPHMTRPKIRPVRGFPVQATSPDGKQVPMLGLADMRQISDKVVFTAPATQFVIPLMDGSRDLDQIVQQVGRGLTRQILEQLVAQLEDAALIEGPRILALMAKVRKEFDETDILPPGPTAAFADQLVVQAMGKDVSESAKAEQGPTRVRDMFDVWMSKALEKVDKPSFDSLPRAIIVPHLDYSRGWINYASVYGRLRVVDRPDRVVILGTNHFGSSTGVAACDKGYQTPLGVCEADKQLIEAMRYAVGEVLYANRYDHEREHSIEMQIMWVQHIFGKDEAGNFPKVFGALVHDPAVANGESYDGSGVSLDNFVKALKRAIGDLPGKTLIIASADLSHCGPAFGDPKPLAGEDKEVQEARNKIVQHDMQMLELVRMNKPGELVASMAWQQNPTRWCSTGNLVATLLTVEPREVQMLNYAATMDQQGQTLVSSAAAVLV